MNDLQKLYWIVIRQILCYYIDIHRCCKASPSQKTRLLDCDHLTLYTFHVTGRIQPFGGCYLPIHKWFHSKDLFHFDVHNSTLHLYSQNKDVWFWAILFYQRYSLKYTSILTIYLKFTCQTYLLWRLQMGLKLNVFAIFVRLQPTLWFWVVRYWIFKLDFSVCRS